MNTAITKRRINALQVEYDRLKFRANMSCVDEPRRRALLHQASDISRQIETLTVEVRNECLTPARAEPRNKFESLWKEFAETRDRNEK